MNSHLDLIRGARDIASAVAHALFTHGCLVACHDGPGIPEDRRDDMPAGGFERITRLPRTGVWLPLRVERISSRWQPKWRRWK